MNSSIKIVPYDESWPKKYKTEAKKIKDVLGENCIKLHHIGSTSIPTCDAKPIVDILVEVPSICLFNEIKKSMENLGYADRSHYASSPRLFFKKSNEFNIHVFEHGYSEIDRFLKFRDWMCSHPEDMNNYINLKKLLSRKSNNNDEYCKGKEQFVFDIEWKAGWRRA